MGKTMRDPIILGYYNLFNYTLKLFMADAPENKTMYVLARMYNNNNFYGFLAATEELYSMYKFIRYHGGYKIESPDPIIKLADLTLLRLSVNDCLPK